MQGRYLAYMVHALKLLLPALIPSWEFFKAVEPSPRVQWRMLSSPKDQAPPWQEFRPRPAKLSVFATIGRLFWNPVWNESLFMVSLAERLMLNPTAHSADEIRYRLAAEIDRTVPGEKHRKYLQFQLIFVSRDENGLTQTITHVAAHCLMNDIAR